MTSHLFHVVIGLAVSGNALYQLRKMHLLRRRIAASVSWPSVTGTITKSGTESHWKSVGGTWFRSHGALVEYEYSVGGTQYTGTQVGFPEINTSSRRRAERKASRYVVGTQVVVFYDPSNPGEAYLEREADASKFMLAVEAAIWGFLIGGLALVVAGVVVR